MDLGTCPRCGAEWRKGIERCYKCGYVPIGAGVKAEKKARKRFRKYVEPGSGRGLVFFVLIGVIGFGGWKYKPWENDWAVLRGWMGQGRIQDVTGEWDVVKSLALKPGSEMLLANRYSGGRLKFAKKGSFGISMKEGESAREGEGSFKTDGRKVQVTGLRAKEGSATLPTKFEMMLTWTSADLAIGAVGTNEILYLRRKKKDQGLLSMFKFGMKPGEDAKVPGAMRGVIANLKDQVEKSQ
ncbi:hypothetical protein [Armatimonas sp.]|uniref:hypothetical protein n=1 Tax=Armatimonas sp. TaxID=1872638 RepID=UPI00286D4B80|nr:hypothetical protein [Armatimonas sp.]